MQLILGSGTRNGAAQAPRGLKGTQRGEFLEFGVSKEIAFETRVMLERSINLGGGPGSVSPSIPGYLGVRKVCTGWDMLRAS